MAFQKVVEYLSCNSNTDKSFATHCKFFSSKALFPPHPTLHRFSEPGVRGVSQGGEGREGGRGRQGTEHVTVAFSLRVP